MTVPALSPAELEIVAGLDSTLQPTALRHRQLALEQGLPFEFLSGLRSRRQQAAEAADPTRTTPAAPPGMSKHEVGFAYDVKKEGRTPAQLSAIGLIGESLGLRWGGRFKPTPDPNHFEAPFARAELASYRTVKIALGLGLIVGAAVIVVGQEGG